MEIAGKTYAFLGPFPSPPDPIKFELLQLKGRFVDALGKAPVDTVVVAVADGPAAARARTQGLHVVTLAELVDHLAPLAPAHRVAGLRRALRPQVGPDSPSKLARALHAATPADGAALVTIARHAIDNGVGLDMNDPEAALAAPPGDAWLLAWCSDADGCRFYAVPSAEAERAGLAAIRGTCFADSSDVDGTTLAILVRVLAAMDAPLGRDPAVLAARHVDGWRGEGFAGSAEDLLPWVGWLEPHLLRAVSQLDRPFTQIVAVNQAM